MKITNNYGLPDPFMNFVRNDKYTRGKADISVTTLIDSPRIRLLVDDHKDKLESDLVDMIWPIFGTAVHSVLESSIEQKNTIVEERLYASCNDWTLSGALDHQEILEDGRIRVTDYKVTSVWSVIHGKKEWEYQQNCYAWLLRQNGKDVESIRICAILRDWQKRKAATDSDYPSAPVVIIDLPLWTRDECQKYVEERMSLHQEAQINYDIHGELPLCSEAEKWERPTTYAVMAKGKKRAIRVLDTQFEADAYLEGFKSTSALNPKDLTIETRKGERVRCSGYCSVSHLCDQYLKESEENDYSD